MVESAISRRTVVLALSGLPLSLTLGATAALAQNNLRFRDILINVEPLRAAVGDTTAAWMEQGLKQELPQVLGARLAPGDRSAAVLEVRIDWIYLGPSGGGTGPGGSAQDTVVGSYIVHGPRGGFVSQTPLRAIAFYYPNAVDQAMVEQAYYWRVVALAKAFAGWAPRELGL